MNEATFVKRKKEVCGVVVVAEDYRSGLDTAGSSQG